MANVDLTGKLGLAGKPTITIGKTVLTVDNSARTMLRIMEAVGDEPGAKEMMAVAELVFCEKDRKALDALELSFEDFAKVVETAMDLITGDDATGEDQTLDTTS